MSLKLPRRVKVGPTPVFISRKKLNGLLGQYHYETNKLDVNKGLAPAEERSTVLHELIHALLHIYGVSHSVGLNKDQEETLIRVIESPLLSLLRDNPKLLEYLTCKD